MRHLLSARLWVALGILVVLGAGLLGALSLTGDGSSPVSGDPKLRTINLIASVSNLQADEGWSIADSKTVGHASLILDDGRTIRITPGTLGEISCTDLAEASACVLLADSLGGAIVWFALVPADTQRPLTHMNMLALVDMLDGGNLGVLANGWVIKLATPTKRTCDTETVTLREFITQYSPDNSMSILDLIADEITEVVCTK